MSSPSLLAAELWHALQPPANEFLEVSNGSHTQKLSPWQSFWPCPQCWVSERRIDTLWEHTYARRISCPNLPSCMMPKLGSWTETHKQDLSNMQWLTHILTPTCTSPTHRHTSASLIFKVKLLGVLRSGTAAPKISWMPPLRQGAVTFLCWLTFYRIAALMVSNFHGRPSVVVLRQAELLSYYQCRTPSWWWHQQFPWDKKDTHVYPSTCVDCRLVDSSIGLRTIERHTERKRKARKQERKKEARKER